MPTSQAFAMPGRADSKLGVDTSDNGVEVVLANDLLSIALLFMAPLNADDDAVELADE